jgi:hypothetical protein
MRATIVLLELFVSRKKKKGAHYGELWAWLDGLQHLFPSLRMSVPSSYTNE